MTRARNDELFAVESRSRQSGEDCPALSVAYKTDGTLSAQGHRAGNPVNIPEDYAFITAAITSLLHT